MTSKRVLPPTYLLAFIVVMIALRFLLPMAMIVPFPWSLFGLVLLAAGILINLIADKAFTKANTTVKPFEESAVLITDGAFRISRHPMYLGFVLILIGIAVIMGALTPFFAIPVFAALMDIVFIRAEERMLEDTFGRTWLEYKRGVRRWI
jgi:protein-S-isoprenylcysteine O-methyltransferase Ste14